MTEGTEKLAVLTRAVGRGRGSGAEVDWTFTTVWGVRNGLIYYHHGYTDTPRRCRRSDPRPVS